MPREVANRDILAVPKELTEDLRRLLVAISIHPHPVSIEQLAEELEVKYHTCRNRLMKLAELGLIKRTSHYRSRPTLYTTHLSEVDVQEILASMKTNLVIVDKNIEEKPAVPDELTLGGQPLEAWLKGYASRDDRTANIKEKADLFPVIIAQLFKIAYDIEDENKLWPVQERLTETKKMLRDIITTYAKLVTIARELFNTEPVWDARTIKEALIKKGITLEKAQELIAAVADNYRRPYVSQDEG